MRRDPLGREDLLRVLPPESVAAGDRPARRSEEMCPGAVCAFTPAASRISPYFPAFYPLTRNRDTNPLVFPTCGRILLSDRGLVELQAGC